MKKHIVMAASLFFSLSIFTGSAQAAMNNCPTYRVWCDIDPVLTDKFPISVTLYVQIGDVLTSKQPVIIDLSDPRIIAQLPSPIGEDALCAFVAKNWGISVAPGLRQGCSQAVGRNFTLIPLNQ